MPVIWDTMILMCYHCNVFIKKHASLIPVTAPHYIDVTWSLRCLKLLATWLFNSLLGQTTKKMSKLHITWPLGWEHVNDQWIPQTKCHLCEKHFHGKKSSWFFLSNESDNSELLCILSKWFVNTSLYIFIWLFSHLLSCSGDWMRKHVFEHFCQTPEKNLKWGVTNSNCSLKQLQLTHSSEYYT